MDNPALTNASTMEIVADILAELNDWATVAQKHGETELAEEIGGGLKHVQILLAELERRYGA